MISVRPTVEPYAEVRANVGNFSTYNIEAAASGEILPGVQARIAAYDHQQDEGYYKNPRGRPLGRQTTSTSGTWKDSCRPNSRRPRRLLEPRLCFRVAEPRATRARGRACRPATGTKPS